MVPELHCYFPEHVLEFAQRHFVAEEQAVPQQTSQLDIHHNCDHGPAVL